MSDDDYLGDSAEELEILTADLKERAREVRTVAHAPYSGFHVGVAVQGRSGLVHTGANVEWAGHFGFHAEELACANAALADDLPIVAVAVSCSDLGGHVPCGRCLHAIASFGRNPRIYTDHGDHWTETDLDSELPNAYRTRFRDRPDSA